MKLKINTVLSLIAVTIISSMVFISCSSDSMNDISSENYKSMSFFTMENGELVRPTGYRSWVYIGTPVTPHDLNGGKAAFPEMHNVYIDPASYKHYTATGKFKEGTILVKELVSVGATSASSGKGYFEGEFIGLEAEVKSKEHFPDEPGNWAIFSFTSPEDGILKDKAAIIPVAQCVACHQANAADDNVFTQYYPVLRAAKAAGENIIPENSARRATEAKSKKIGLWDPTAPSPSLIAGISSKEEDLFKWLQKGEYKKWKNQETRIHASLGPHEDVKAFINDKLAASLAAGNKVHPKGSFAVKEQYKDGKGFGWAIMAKTSEEVDEGKEWFWYEVTSNDDINEKAAYGNGVSGCVTCHISGNDMVRISFPLE